MVKAPGPSHYTTRDLGQEAEGSTLWEKILQMIQTHIRKLSGTSEECFEVVCAVILQ